MKKRIVNTKQRIKNRGVNKLEFKKAEGRIFKEDDQGEEIAVITYVPAGEDVVDANHTFVDPSLRGQGVAEKLVEALVEDMEKEGKKIKPGCPYVEALFERKPDKYGHINADV